MANPLMKQLEVKEKYYDIPSSSRQISDDTYNNSETVKDTLVIIKEILDNLNTGSNYAFHVDSNGTLSLRKETP